MLNFEKFQPIFPFVYLTLAAAVAVIFHLLTVPNEVAMLIVGAALTRVKVGTPKP